jgi:subfamily B ATP-binding cassette protein MsbA
MSPSVKKSARSFSDFAQLKQLFDRTKISVWSLLLPVGLTVATAAFEGLSLGLLIPLVKGVLAGDFSFVEKISALRFVLPHLGLDVMSDAQIFISLTVIVAAAAVLKNLFQYFSLVLFDRKMTELIHRMRRDIFVRYLSFGKKFFDENNVGHLNNMVLVFTRQISTSLKSIFSEYSNILMLVIYFGLMLFISWQLTLTALLLFPVLHYATSWLILKVRRDSKNVAGCHRELGFLISNVIMGISLIKGCSYENEEKDRFGSLSSRSAAAEFSMLKKQRALPVIQELIALGAFLIFIAVIAFLYMREGGEIAAFLVFFVVLRRTMAALGSFNRIRISTAEAGGFVEQISALFDDEGKPFVADGRAEFPGLKKEIRFRHLNFAYDSAREILCDIGLTVEKGKTAALVGKTGSGKTTLVHLLMRFYDCGPGMIFLDGEDIRNFTLKSLHAHMALVSQDTVLFNDTLRTNMTYGVPFGTSDEEIFAAAKKARLDDFIQVLPNGLETMIGDRGIQLSGGERQRVAIARAILRGAEILILDEATSALDSKTEKMVQEAIEEAIKGKTAIVIAHRLSTIRRADKIVVLEAGRIVEEGSLECLLANKKTFSEYWEGQGVG